MSLRFYRKGARRSQRTAWSPSRARGFVNARFWRARSSIVRTYYPKSGASFSRYAR